MDFSNLTIRITGFNIPPWLNRVNTTKFNGTMNEIKTYLEESMKFNGVFVKIPNEREMHGKMVNGVLNGALGMLHRNETDIIIAPAGINGLRFKYSRMPLPFAYTDMTILSGLKQDIDIHAIEIFSGLPDLFWILFFASLALVSTIAWYTEYITKKVQTGRDAPKMKIFRYAWEMLLCLFSMQINVPQVLNSVRLIIAVWFFGAIIINIIISGNMTANMAAKETPDKIDILKDIIKYPEMEPAILTGSIHLALIRMQNKLETIELMNQIQRHNSTYDMKRIQSSDTYKKILNRTLAHINDRYTLMVGIKKHCLEKSLKGFYMAKDLIFELPVSMMFNRLLTKEFMEAINVRMLKIFEARLAQSLLLNSLAVPPSCFGEPPIPGFSEIDVGTILPAFELYAKGLCISVVLFIAELAHHALGKIYRSRKTKRLPKRKKEFMFGAKLGSTEIMNYLWLNRSGPKEWKANKEHYARKRF